MTQQPPTIFIVEDNPETQSRYAKSFRDRVIIIPATSIEEAERLWKLHQSKIKLVIMDGCMPGNDFSTPPLVNKIRETFAGPIIASSTSEYCCEVLMKTGCTHQVEKKTFAPALAMQILGLKP